MLGLLTNINTLIINPLWISHDFDAVALQLLSRSVIETPLHLLNLLRRQIRKRAVLGTVLTDQSIGVLDVWLVHRAVGVRKVNRHP